MARRMRPKKMALERAILAGFFAAAKAFPPAAA